MEKLGTLKWGLLIAGNLFSAVSFAQEKKNPEKEQFFIIVAGIPL